MSRTLTITNPLILYRSLLQTKQIAPDPAQYRLALHLQKLYANLLDYSPENEYGARLKAIGKLIGDMASEEGNERGNKLAALDHPIRRNPLFAHIFAEKQKRDSLALTRVLTNHEEAMALDSPKGLLLHGEVGTGKSMMVDLLAHCLPNKKKRRWHFNHFMLEILARLEQRRICGLNEDDSEHSLIWLAKDLVDKSPILFLDEFQMPDRTAAKILSNLLTAFFQLGGVLVASSNRMPDELSKAPGLNFTAPARGGFMRKWLGYGDVRKPSMFPSNNEYTPFVEVLKARCEIWDIRGDRDWRRRDEEVDDTEVPETKRQEMIEEGKSLKLPKKYLTLGDNEAWQEAIQAALPTNMPSPIPWQSCTILVYGRNIPVPKLCEGVVLWTFHELCESTLGPADFISLASTFHTFILDQVPTMHVSQKNEARRFITLLDALYEAGCKLVVRAESDPDHLFFPEIRANPGFSTGPEDENEGDAVYPETLSEIHQDQTSPFRPNISLYTDEPRAGYDPDEDSDFGPTPGKGNEIGRQVDFWNTVSFTGLDEQFSYKRASSRLWEMCGVRWHARSDLNWWTPLPLQVRSWERSVASATKSPKVPSGGDVKLGPSIELDKQAGLQGKMLKEMERNSNKEQTSPPPLPPTGRWHN